MLFSRLSHPRIRGAIVITATALGVAGLGGASAAAMTGSHRPPGDNGTVKVHRSTTSADDRRNEPHVCDFYLVGFNFDPAQQVSWHILSWPPTGNRRQVLHGTLTLGQDGHGRTADLSLPNGHYKLFWNFNGEHGRAKQKVFWVKCSQGKPTPPPSSSPTPTTAPTQAPSGQSPAPVPTPVPSELPVTG